MDQSPTHLHIDTEDARERLEDAIGRPLFPLSRKDVTALVSMSPEERTRWALTRAKAQDVVTAQQIALARTVHPDAPGPEETDEDRRAARNARKRERRARYA